jgi:hypothetical protein
MRRGLRASSSAPERAPRSIPFAAMEIVLALVIVALLGWLVTAPLRGEDSESDGPATEDPRRADLEARKQALYRQIRDAELDREQGKLSDEDWRRADTELRREAIAVLRELDALG